MTRRTAKPTRFYLRVPELLKAEGITAAELARRSGGRISQSVAYRLADGDWQCLPGATLDALCDVFDLPLSKILVRRPPRPGA